MYPLLARFRRWGEGVSGGDKTGWEPTDFTQSPNPRVLWTKLWIRACCRHSVRVATERNPERTANPMHAICHTPQKWLSVIGFYFRVTFRSWSYVWCLNYLYNLSQGGRETDLKLSWSHGHKSKFYSQKLWGDAWKSRFFFSVVTVALILSSHLMFITWGVELTCLNVYNSQLQWQSQESQAQQTHTLRITRWSFLAKQFDAPHEKVHEVKRCERRNRTLKKVYDFMNSVSLIAFSWCGSRQKIWFIGISSPEKECAKQTTKVLESIASQKRKCTDKLYPCVEMFSSWALCVV